MQRFLKRLPLLASTAIALSPWATGFEVTSPALQVSSTPASIAEGSTAKPKEAAFPSREPVPRSLSDAQQQVMLSPQIWTRHPTQSEAVALSDDGQILACAPDDYTVQIWDVSADRMVHVIQLRYEAPALAFAPGGHTLVLGNQGGEIQTWDIQGDNPTNSAKFNSQVTQIVCSRDRHSLGVGFGDGSIRVLDSGSLGEKRSVRAFGGPVLSLALSPDGGVIAGGDQELDSSGKAVARGLITVWNFSDLSPMHSIEAHAGAIRGLAFRPDGKRLASASDDHTVKIWDADSWTEMKKLELHQDAVLSVAFSPKGDLFASGGQDGLTLFWSGDSFDLVKTAPMYVGYVNQLQFAPDGSFLLRAGNSVDLVQVAVPSLIHRFESFKAGIYATAVSPKGTWLASGGANKELRLLKLGSAENHRLDLKHWITSIAFTPDEEFVAVGTERGLLVVLRTSTFEEQWRTNVHTGAINSLVFSPDGKLMASAGDDGHIRLWETGAWRQVSTGNGHRDSICAVAFNESGDKLYSCCHDGTVNSWDIPSLAQSSVSKSFNNTPVSMSVGQQEVAVGLFDGSILFLSKDDLSIRSKLKDSTRPVLGLSYSPDGRYLASSNDRGEVALWDPGSHESVWKDNKALVNDVFSICWFPNSGGLLTGDSQSNITAWTFGR
jgi:WD40 repeat protein